MLLDGVVAQVRHSVPWCAGSRELLLALHAAGVPCGLVTMSYQRFVAPILEHLPPETFRAVVTGDRIRMGKPHPEPYLTAAAALGSAAAVRRTRSPLLSVKAAATATASPSRWNRKNTQLQLAFSTRLAANARSYVARSCSRSRSIAIADVTAMSA